MKPNILLWNSSASSLQQSKKPHGPRMWIFLIVLLFLIAAGQFPPVANMFSGVVTNLAAPLLRGYSFAASRFAEYGSVFTDRRELIERQRELAEEVAALEAKTRVTDMVMQENRTLKRLLGRNLEERNAVLAAVLSKPNRTPYDTLLIDAGRKQKISAGDFVVAHGSFAIGIIEEAFNTASRVKLLSAPGNEVEVMVGPEHITTTAVGSGGGSFTAQLPHGADVEEGTDVVFPDIEPRLVATVAGIQADPSDSFKTLYFKLPINIYELRWVEVLPRQEIGEAAGAKEEVTE